MVCLYVRTTALGFCCCFTLFRPEVSSIFDTHDIVMFTETWSNESKIKCTNFQHFCLHRERRKNCKRDSSGIIIYIKDTCVNDKSLFFKSEDNILWLRLDIFFLDNDLFIGLCNVVPESSGRFNLQVQNVFDRLLNSVSLIYNYTDGHCNIILSGDFNSRTCDCSGSIDYDLDNDLLLLPDNYVFYIYYVLDVHRIKAIPVTVLRL